MFFGYNALMFHWRYSCYILSKIKFISEGNRNIMLFSFLTQKITNTIWPGKAAHVRLQYIHSKKTTSLDIEPTFFYMLNSAQPRLIKESFILNNMTFGDRINLACDWWLTSWLCASELHRLRSCWGQEATWAPVYHVHCNQTEKGNTNIPHDSKPNKLLLSHKYEFRS